jgi:hypothetical protein
MKIKICSEKHFKHLLISFDKYFKNEINKNVRLNLFKDSFEYLFYDPETISKFELIKRKILLKFKNNPYKTCSKFVHKDRFIINNVWSDIRDVNLWFSYSIENENNKRIKNFEINNNSFIVFKVYMKIENGRKRRIFRWKIKMNWIK